MRKEYVVHRVGTYGELEETVVRTIHWDEAWNIVKNDEDTALTVEKIEPLFGVYRIAIDPEKSSVLNGLVEDDLTLEQAKDRVAYHTGNNRNCPTYAYYIKEIK